MAGLPSSASTIEEYANFISACLKELNLNSLHLCGTVWVISMYVSCIIK